MFGCVSAWQLDGGNATIDCASDDAPSTSWRQRDDVVSETSTATPGAAVGRVGGEDGPMSRLPLRTRDELEDDAREVWDSITATRGSIVTDDGALMGPFNAWVTAPTVGGRLAELGAALRFESSVERRLLEVVIITVGARWRAEFEWWAHSRMALHHGVSQETVDAIARGETPAMPDDERIVHAVARQLLDDGHVDGETYDAARDLLGDRGVVEIVTLCGYYTLVSFTLNAFDVALPPGEAPTWPGQGG
jgi:4-carboxymuconolactone decarboxylase